MISVKYHFSFCHSITSHSVRDPFNPPEQLLHLNSGYRFETGGENGAPWRNQSYCFGGRGSVRIISHDLSFNVCECKKALSNQLQRYTQQTRKTTGTQQTRKTTRTGETKKQFFTTNVNFLKDIPGCSEQRDSSLWNSLYSRMATGLKEKGLRARNRIILSYKMKILQNRVAGKGRRRGSDKNKRGAYWSIFQILMPQEFCCSLNFPKFGHLLLALQVEKQNFIAGKSSIS